MEVDPIVLSVKAKKEHAIKYNYINLDKLSPKEKILLARLDEEKEVRFCFWKKDGAGEVRREARGTRNPTYIPPEKWSKNPTEDVGKRINYFDFDRQDWRAVSVGRLIEVRNA